MNKKKTLITVGIYLACLAIVICLFVGFTSNQSSKAQTVCYVATQDIKGGTVVDSNLVATSLKQETVHISEKELKESYNAKLIPEASVLINKQTVGFIPAGTVLTTRMFQKITDEVPYPDFNNPQYITLPVSTESMPAEGFKKDADMTIVGLMSMSDLSSTELTEESTETWVGIITNKSKVYSIIKDEVGTVTNVIMVVEKDVYPTLLISASNAKLYYLYGKVNDISEVQSDVIKSIYESTGLSTTQEFDVVAKTSSDNLNWDLEIVDDIDAELTHLEILNVGENNPLNIEWTGEPTKAFIKHYDLTTGLKGDYYGSYSYASTDSTRKINYDSNSEEHTFALPFEKQGYYEISFYNQENEFKGKTTFVIETIEQSWKALDANEIKVGMTLVESSGVSKVEPNFAADISEYSINAKMVKDYFSVVEPLNNYYETIHFTDADNGINSFNTKYILNEKDKIGSFFGDEITNVYLTLTIDGSSVSVPIFYRVKDSTNTIDYPVTDTQVQRLRELLNSNIDKTKASSMFNYTELNNLLTVLETLGDNTSTKNDSEGNYYSVINPLLKDGDNYTPLSFLLRCVLTKETMSEAEFKVLHELLYTTSIEGGIPSKLENNSMQISIEVGKDIYDLDLTFITLFDLTNADSKTETTETEGEE